MDKTLDKLIQAAWQKHRGEDSYDPGYPILASSNFEAGYKAGQSDVLNSIWHKESPDKDLEHVIVIYGSKSSNYCYFASYDFESKEWRTTENGDVLYNAYVLAWMDISILTKDSNTI